MALGKMLELGGIDNKPSKANQTSNRFRVARNVYPTPDGRIIPRYDASAIAGLPANVKCVHNISQYGEDPLFLCTINDSGTYKYVLYRGTTKVPLASEISQSPFNAGLLNDYPQQVMSFRRNNTTFLLNPVDGTLIKYDGLEASYAGTHIPHVFPQAINNTPDAYTMIVQHRFDWDGNYPLSAPVKYQIKSSTALGNSGEDGGPTFLAIRTDGGGINTISSDNTYPKYIQDYTREILCSTVSGSNKIKIVVPVGQSYNWATGAELVVGMYVTGTGIPNAKIAALNPTTASTGFITLNVNATATLASTLLTFQITPEVELVRGCLNLNREYTKKISGDVYFKFDEEPFNQPWIYNSTTKDLTANPNLSFTATCDGTNYITLTNNVIELNLNEPLTGTGIPANTKVLYSIGSNKYKLTNAISAGTKTFVRSIDTNITDSNIGSYIVLNYSVGFGDSLVSTVRDVKIVALKIKSASPLKLDCLNAKYLAPYVGSTEWVDFEYEGYTTFTSGGRTFISGYNSPSENGVYRLAYTYLSFPDSNISNFMPMNAVATPTVILSGPNPTQFNNVPYGITFLGNILNDVYDLNSLKLNYNTDYDFGGNFSLYCSTVYQDQLLIANDNIIYASDVTSGGIFEATTASSFFVIGNYEFGRITAICGTQDFLIVCRERKIYYVNGNLSTANYRVQEIDVSELGAWNNTAAISIKGNVILINSLGVFQISDGGRCIKLSENCPKNFDFFDNTNVNEDVSFRLTGFVSYPYDENGLPANQIPDDGIAVAYDEYRELLVFMKKEAGNPALVMSTRTGEFYEWDGLMNLGDVRANTIGCIQSKYYLGGIDKNVTATAGINLENKTASLAYCASYPIKLYTSWLTAGEPSLEKNLLQLKMFGRLQSNGTTSSINVAHYKDWDISTKITNSPYFPTNTSLSLNNQKQYSHKKRLNSDKVLSSSVGFEINTTGVTFELESIEVEFNPIQEGMKK